jgi:hypothetical protein
LASQVHPAEVVGHYEQDIWTLCPYWGDDRCNRKR